MQVVYLPVDSQNADGFYVIHLCDTCAMSNRTIRAYYDSANVRSQYEGQAFELPLQLKRLTSQIGI